MFCLAHFFYHQENEVLDSLPFSFVIFFNGLKMLQILQPGLIEVPPKHDPYPGSILILSSLCCRNSLISLALSLEDSQKVTQFD